MIKFVVYGELPALNEIIAAAKSHYGNYSKLKHKNTDRVILAAKQQHIPQMDKINITIAWYCKNKRKDKDNVSAGQKFILDGLQKAGIIANDGWSNIGDIRHKFDVDKQCPRVEVILEEIA